MLTLACSWVLIIRWAYTAIAAFRQDSVSSFAVGVDYRTKFPSSFPSHCSPQLNLQLLSIQHKFAIKLEGDFFFNSQRRKLIKGKASIVIRLNFLCSKKLFARYNSSPFQLFPSCVRNFVRFACIAVPPPPQPCRCCNGRRAFC